MSNSSLVNCAVLSPNHSGKRTHKISRITPHCVVGQLTAENIGGCFLDPANKVSCNYGIGHDGRVCLIVDEANRSWCSSSESNDQRAITIECASDKSEPYAMNNAVYNKLIDLCIDICKRNGITKLLWFADKNKSLSYEPAGNEAVLTVHRWFANKSCPGDWLYSRMGDLASKVTANINSAAPQQQSTDVIYRVQVGAFKNKDNALALESKLKAAGFDCFITTSGGGTQTPAPTPAPKPTIKEGSRVKIKPEAKSYTGGKLASFVYSGTYTVDELKGDRAVLDSKGICTPMNVKDLILT